MHLEAEHRKFMKRLRYFEGQLGDFAATHNVRELNFEQLMFLEGLLSNLWQSWGRFSRSIFLKSAMGATTRSGSVTHPIDPITNSESRISYIAIRLAKGNRIDPLLTNLEKRKEPTWGDIDVLHTIVNASTLTNKSKLSSGLTLDIYPKILQSIRNSSAHTNTETIQSIYDYASLFTSFKIQHPCEALFWTDNTSKDFLGMTCIATLGIMAEIATE
ncbi:hypothetical protein [Rheinheimera sp.]|uniref:hypothetical protein n=1 Tax=Rheinheimera sp. TaxID=1869214 RepID=UPI0027B9A355|nr:hypothetical protein [Rheinheimera sp.]